MSELSPCYGSSLVIKWDILALFQIVATRPFVEYFLHNNISKAIIEYFSNTLIPDEYIWPTLNHNPHLAVPGGYRGM